VYRLLILPLLILLGAPAVALAATPAVGYATYFGGNSDDWITAAAVDRDGNLYLTGFTYSGDLAGGPAQEPRRSDIVDTKLDPPGTRVLYTTVFGGGDVDQSNAIAVDAGGHVWVVGETASDDFPAIDALQPTVPNPDFFNGFAARLDPQGGLIFSSYFGEEGAARAVALDQGGNPVIGGNLGDAIVAKLDRRTNDLVFAIRVATTTMQPRVNALALDSQGRIFVTGQVKEQTLPTEGGLQPSCARFSTSECSEDAFLLRVAADGRTTTYGTFLGGSAANGGSGSDQGTGVAVGVDGSVYIVGETYASDFPTRNAFQAAKAGPNNFSEAFVTRLVPQGNGYALGYSTYLGGRGSEGARGVAVDAEGNAAVVGYTGSLEFPVVAPVQRQLGNGVCELGGSERNCYDPFITRLAPDGTVSFSSFFGGALDDLGVGVALGPRGGLYVVGHTEARDFPVSLGALQPQRALRADGFVVRLGPEVQGGEKPFRVALPLLRR
jgi:hypothetical protein